MGGNIRFGGGKEYPFWWSKETTDMTRLLSHKTSQVEGVQTRCKTWTLRKEHKIENGKSFDIRQNPTSSVKKKVKNVSKRGKQLQPNEVMRSRKIEVSLTAKQKRLFENWSDVYCFTYNCALQLFQTDTFQNMDIYTEKPSKKTGKYKLITGWPKIKT